MDYFRWKKVCIILLIISILINIFSKVFASYDINIDNVDYKFPDVFSQYQYIILFNLKNNGLYACAANSPFYFQLGTGVNGSTYKLAFKQTTTYKYVETNNLNTTNFSNLTVGTWTQSVSSSTGLAIFASGTVYPSSLGTAEIVLANFDVYDFSDNLVFSNNVDSILYPFFSTPDSDINSLSFDKLYVEPADYGTENPLYLHSLEITQTITENSSTIYYYTDNLFRLDNTSPYYTQFVESDYYYYGIPRRKLGFNVDTAYLLVLSDSPDIITNSVGPIVEDASNGIFEAVSVNTTDIYTYQQVIDDNIQNIQDDLTNTDSNISDDDISDNFDYDTENAQLTNNHSGFFTRLLNLFTNLYDYDLNSDSPIQIPMPNSNKKIVLHSNIISSNIGEPLKSIIGAFWMYIFYLYAWKFFNYIYIEIQSGKILDDESSSVPRCYSY